MKSLLLKSSMKTRIYFLPDGVAVSMGPVMSECRSSATRVARVPLSLGADNRVNLPSVQLWHKMGFVGRGSFIIFATLLKLRCPKRWCHKLMSFTCENVCVCLMSPTDPSLSFALSPIAARSLSHSCHVFLASGVSPPFQSGCIPGPPRWSIGKFIVCCLLSRNFLGCILSILSISVAMIVAIAGLLSGAGLRQGRGSTLDEIS